LKPRVQSLASLFALAWSATVSAGLLFYAAAVGSTLRRDLLLVPVLASVLPLLPYPRMARRAFALASALISALFIVITVFSIGFLFFPSAFALFVASGRADPPHDGLDG